MKSQTLYPVKKLQGQLTMPGDKSLSHRALIFASLAKGESTIKNLLLAEDVLATMKILQQLGVQMSHRPLALKPGDELRIEGCGLDGLKGTDQILDCGNSGTTMRLLLGLLAAQSFDSKLTGDDSLNKRPMGRVMDPLSQMGARFVVADHHGRRVICVKGGQSLNGIDYQLPVASAQIKSALLLAGLYASQPVTVVEPALSRDHTERMLKSMGVPMTQNGLKISVASRPSLKPLSLEIPGDFSSAAFFIVGGLMIPNSQIVLKSVGVNPTRSALIDVLKNMGGAIEYSHPNHVSGEPVSDIQVKSSRLKGTKISGDVIPLLIDEIPIFSIAAASAEGQSAVSDAAELRVKESDRIAVLTKELLKLGVDIQEKKDGFIIHGGRPFCKNTFESHGDHRIAMSLSVAALAAQGASTINNIDCVATSFPSFFKQLEEVSSSSH